MPTTCWPVVETQPAELAECPAPGAPGRYPIDTECMNPSEVKIRTAFISTFPSKNKIHDRRLRGNVASVAYALRVFGGQYDPKGGDCPPKSASGLLLPLCSAPKPSATAMTGAFSAIATSSNGSGVI